MDAALLLIAGNEPCPQPQVCAHIYVKRVCGSALGPSNLCPPSHPTSHRLTSVGLHVCPCVRETQTSEHLAAVEIMKLSNIIIMQNKIDLVRQDAAHEQHQQIRDFVAGTVAGRAPIIPISAQLKYNIDVVVEYLATRIPVPVRDFTSDPRLIVIRSFDVNMPGEDVENLKGGVAGGSILHGVLRVGDEIEIRPGIVSKDDHGNFRCAPIYSKAVSLFAEKNELQYAVPGGLIGVGTHVDPTLTRADRLVGQVRTLGIGGDRMGKTKINNHKAGGRGLVRLEHSTYRSNLLLCIGCCVCLATGTRPEGSAAGGVHRVGDQFLFVATTPGCEDGGLQQEGQGHQA